MLNRFYPSKERVGHHVKQKCDSYMKPLVYIALLAMLIGGSLTTQAKDSESVLSPEQLKDLAPKIEAAEKRLRNIKIDSEIWVETKANLSDPCEPWPRSPVCVSSTAWFTGDWSCQTGISPQGNSEGHAKGKARVDVHKEVLEWQEGVAPYAEESYSMGFDGQHGRIVFHTRGELRKALPVKEGRILPEAPDSLKWGWYHRFTGLDFTLNFFFRGKEYTFSDLFRWSDDPKSTVPSCFEFTREVYQGVQCIKVATKGTIHFQKSWWLDPSRGFALLGYKYIRVLEDGTERIRNYIEVNKLKKVSDDGVWWPIEATLISEPLNPGRPLHQNCI